MNKFGGPMGPQIPQPPAHPPPQYGLPGRNPWHKPIRRNANIVCFGLLLTLLLGIFLLPVYNEVARFFIYGMNLDSAGAVSFIEMAGNLITYVAMFMVPLIIMRLWIDIPVRVAFPVRCPRISFVLPGMMLCLGASVIGVLLYGTITVAMQALFGVQPAPPPLPDPIGIPANIAYILSVTVAPAILEEMMFRGVIMQSLRRFGDGFALCCSAILFSFAHHNLVQGPNALLLGLLLGYFVLRTGSLLTGMLIHLINNSLAIGIEYCSRSLTEQAAVSLSAMVFGIYAVLGLMGLAFLLLRHGNMFHVYPSGYPVPEGRKYRLFFLTFMPIVYVLAVLVLTCLQFE